MSESRLKPEWVMDRQGKKVVLYAGLLHLAHEDGLKAVHTKVVQCPHPSNGDTTIVEATVETTKGTFSGIGDATPENVGRMVAPHAIRMAETRAKARALRDALDISFVTLEELGDLTDAPAPTPERAPGVATNGAARVNADLRPRPAPVVHEPWPEPDGAPHPADTEARPTPVRQSGALATPKQLQTIARMARASGKTVDTEGMSMAKASEVISSLIGEMGQLRVVEPGR